MVAESKPGQGTGQGVALLFVFVGGAAGALAREALVSWVLAPWFWIPILVVNVSACFALGFLLVYRDRLGSFGAPLLATGFLGGFSTFSQFTYELVTLGESGAWSEAAAYVALTVFLGIGAVVLGDALARRAAGIPPA